MTYQSLERKGQEILTNNNIYPGFAKMLMVEMLREDNKDLYQLQNDTPTKEFIEQYQINIDLLTQDIPLGYVLGYEWFYGYKFVVNEDVLIPREETEELVGNILMAIDERYDNPTIIDVGCGSGAIAITLDKEVKANTYASDISAKAVKVAEKNNELLKANVRFFVGDMLQPFVDNNIKADVIVCNPPYIKNTEEIQTSVLNYEPHVALFGGDDGLYFYRQLLDKAHIVLNDKGLMAFEIGYDIGNEVVALVQSYFPNAFVELIKDLNGLDRMVLAYT